MTLNALNLWDVTLFYLSSVVHSWQSKQTDTAIDRGEAALRTEVSTQRVKTSLLTQKMKLKKKSMYLMHLVQPSTPMMVRKTNSVLSSQDGSSRPGIVACNRLSLDRESWLQLEDRGNTQLLPPSRTDNPAIIQSQQHSGLPVTAFKVKSIYTTILWDRSAAQSALLL